MSSLIGQRSKIFIVPFIGNPFKEHTRKPQDYNRSLTNGILSEGIRGHNHKVGAAVSTNSTKYSSNRQLGKKWFLERWGFEGKFHGVSIPALSECQALFRRFREFQDSRMRQRFASNHPNNCWSH